MKPAATKAPATHFHWLDLLRFLAALIVVLAHARGASFLEYGALAEASQNLAVTLFFALTRIANEAVILFFVLSGFLVGGQAMKRIAQGSFRPVDYAIDRFVRIMLPLLPALALTAIIQWVIGKDVSLVELMGNILSVQGIAVEPFGHNIPLWSLSYEVWFYTLMFVVGIAVNPRVSALLVMLSLLALAAVFTSLSYVYLFCWLLGALAFLKRPSRISAPVLVLALLLFVYALLGTQFGKDSNSLPVADLRNYFPSLQVSRLLLSAAFALLIQQAILWRPRNALAISLDNAGTRLAASSYTMYLAHYPLIHLASYLGLERAERVDAASLGMYSVVVAGCLLAAWLLYLLFERHTIRLRRAIKRTLYGSNYVRRSLVPVLQPDGCTAEPVKGR